MIGYWTQFARTGNPNGEGLPRWPKFELEDEAYLELGDRIAAGTALGKEACERLERLIGDARN